jgi:hypothetical protein
MGDVLGVHSSTGESLRDFSLVVQDPADIPAGSRPVHRLYVGDRQVLRTFDVATLAYGLLGHVESLLLSERDDRVFINALALAGTQTILLPGELMPVISTLRRRLHRAGVRTPLTDWVAMDARSGLLVPTDWTLGHPEELVARFGGPGDDHFIVEEPTAIDTVALWHGPAAPGSPTRAATVAELARRTTNLGPTGSAALYGIARVIGGCTVTTFAGESRDTLADWIVSTARAQAA